MTLKCRITYLECRLPLVSTRNNWPQFLSGGEISPGLSGRLLKTVLHRMKQRRKRSCDLFIVARAKLAVHVNQLSIADITELHRNRRGLKRGDFENNWMLYTIALIIIWYLILIYYVALFFLCVCRLTNTHYDSSAAEEKIKTKQKYSTCFHSIICKKIKQSFRNLVYLLLCIFTVTIQNTVELQVPGGKYFFYCQDVDIHGIYVENSPTHSLRVICYQYDLFYFISLTSVI